MDEGHAAEQEREPNATTGERTSDRELVVTRTVDGADQIDVAPCGSRVRIRAV